MPRPLFGGAAFFSFADVSLLFLGAAGRRSCRGSLVGHGRFGFFRRRRLVSASAGKNAFDCVVALMAGVFEDPALLRTELVFAAPRPGPYGRILGLELIQNAVRTDAGKALGNLQFLPSTAKRGRLREVGGFNHQCRTFVPADGIAHPGTRTVGTML